jgi:hypothetical protein
MSGAVETGVEDSLQACNSETDAAAASVRVRDRNDVIGTLVRM